MNLRTFSSSSWPSEKLNSHPLMPSHHWILFCSNFLVVIKNLHFPPATLFFSFFFCFISLNKKEKRHKKYLAYLNRKKKCDWSLSPLPFLLFSIHFFVSCHHICQVVMAVIVWIRNIIWRHCVVVLRLFENIIASSTWPEA